MGAILLTMLFCVVVPPLVIAALVVAGVIALSIFAGAALLAGGIASAAVLPCSLRRLRRAY